MADPEEPRPWPLLVLFAAALALRLSLFVIVGYSADDALITFRYAENLASGNGFVYNIGERVLGTTTPVFTLLIAGMLKLGFTPFAAAFALNALADLFTAFVLWKMFSTFRFPANWVPAAVFLFSPETLQWSLSGMEVELSIACLFGAFWFASRNSWGTAFAFGALATLVRVDGAAVLVALAAGHVIQRGKLPAIPLALAAAILAPWIAFAFVYFGSPIPNSAAAKWALSGQNWLTAGSQILLTGFLHLHTFGAFLLVPALLGTGEIIRSRREWLPLAIWTWGYSLSYALAAGPMHPWYYAPFYAGYLALIWTGAVAIEARWTARWPVRAAGAIVIGIVLLLSYYRMETLRRDAEGVNRVNREVGQWIAAHTPPESVVALKDIGFSGYYSRRKVLDLAGLVSPECVPYRIRGDFLGPLLAFRPRYFAFSEGQLRHLDLEGSGLSAIYKRAAEIRQGDGAYIIFELR